MSVKPGVTLKLVVKFKVPSTDPGFYDRMFEYFV